MSRTNVNSSSVPKGQTVTTRFNWLGAGNYSYSTTVEQSNAANFAETRGSSVTPGFNSRTPPVPLPVNAFSYSNVKMTYWTGYTAQRSLFAPSAAYVDKKVVGYPSIGDTYPNTPITTADVDNARRIAIDKLRANIKDMDVNAGQVMAEAHMTWDLIANAAKRAHGAITHLRRGDIVGAASNLGVAVGRRPRSRFNKSFKRNQAEAVARGWLELQYGWKPLLQDVHGAIEQASKGKQALYQVAVGRKTIKRELQRTIDNLGSQSQYYTGFDKTILNGSARCTVRVGCTFIVSNSTARTAAQIGLANPALLAWELLPFSFVADWFLPIGNYISSWDATVGLSFVNGYVTTFKKFQGTGTAVASNIYNPSLLSNWKLCTCMREEVYVTREVLGAFPSPQLPRFKNPASMTHAANAIGLLVGLFRGK